VSLDAFIASVFGSMTEKGEATRTWIDKGRSVGFVRAKDNGMIDVFFHGYDGQAVVELNRDELAVLGDYAQAVGHRDAEKLARGLSEGQNLK
jgi:hypothetical protein